MQEINISINKFEWIHPQIYRAPNRVSFSIFSQISPNDPYFEQLYVSDELIWNFLFIFINIIYIIPFMHKKGRGYIYNTQIYDRLVWETGRGSWRSIGGDDVPDRRALPLSPSAFFYANIFAKNCATNSYLYIMTGNTRWRSRRLWCCR